MDRPVGEAGLLLNQWIPPTLNEWLDLVDLHGLASTAYPVPVSRLAANPVDYTKDNSCTLTRANDLTEQADSLGP